MMINQDKIPASALVKYVPQGHSPKVYIKMVEQIMGVDSQGHPRSYEDLVVFLVACKRSGLDPLAKQIYPVYRWDTRLGKEKMSIQAGIDGLRAVAERSGLYAGSDDAVFEEKNGQPIKATVTVYKINKIVGDRMPITASARWSEYVQLNPKTKGPMGMWGKMPFNQLSKCAESLALRKAFPNDLVGIYSDEEMAQAKGIELPPPTPRENGNLPIKITTKASELTGK
jgi:phage recombination protein Bet